VAQPETAIETEGLRRTFGATTALDGVSLAAPAGKVLGLLGPNGAGKTTLVRILATLLAPTAGTARVLGCDVVKDAARLRGMIGLTGQAATVDELLTGRENLEMIAGLYHLPRSRARQRSAELLEQFGLADAAGRRSGTYSGGMRRRLDLAAISRLDTCRYRNMIGWWPALPRRRMSSTPLPICIGAKSWTRYSKARRQSGRSRAISRCPSLRCQSTSGC
jgi:ABC-type lipopolysaccharide export system ATPase subunit